MRNVLPQFVITIATCNKQFVINLSQFVLSQLSQFITTFAAICNTLNFHGRFSVILNMILVSYITAKLGYVCLELKLTAHATDLKDVVF